MRFVIVTGMSGAGRSTALRVLEDAGYFCVDNLPISLIEKFSELIYPGNTEVTKAALGIDIRSGKAFDELAAVLEISVGDILRALEGSLDAVNCPGLEEESSCDGSEFCVTKYVWQKINDSINRTVDEMKLDQIVRESKSMKDEAGTQENTSCCI